MTAPLVSVVIPCFNSGKTLSRSIESILNQDWPTKQIIIVNDGSTDSFTLDVIDSFSSNSIIKVISQNNCGLAAARNIGIKNADGEFIIPLDSDDWLEPTAIKEMFNAYLEVNSDCIVYSDINFEFERIGVKKTFCNPFEQMFTNQLPYCMFLPKKFFDEIVGYDEAFIYGLEDWDLNIRLIFSGCTFKKVELPLFHYSVAKSGMLQSITIKKFGSIFMVIKKKHSNKYRFSELRRLKIKSSGVPSNNNLNIYYLQNFCSIVLPSNIYNYIFVIINKLKYLQNN